MAALICLGCSAVYTVGAAACPQCGADDPVPDHEATVEQVRALIKGTPGAAVAKPPQANTSTNPPPAPAAAAAANAD